MSKRHGVRPALRGGAISASREGETSERCGVALREIGLHSVPNPRQVAATRHGPSPAGSRVGGVTPLARRAGRPDRGRAGLAIARRSLWTGARRGTARRDRPRTPALVLHSRGRQRTAGRAPSRRYSQRHPRRRPVPSPFPGLRRPMTDAPARFEGPRPLRSRRSIPVFGRSTPGSPPRSLFRGSHNLSAPAACQRVLGGQQDCRSDPSLRAGSALSQHLLETVAGGSR